MQQDKAAKPTHLGVPAPSVPPAWRLIFLAGAEMVAERFYEKVEFRRFYSEAGLRTGSSALRGAWFWTLLEMWSTGVYELKRTVLAWAKEWNCTARQAGKLIVRLRDAGVADVTCNGDVTASNTQVTLVCRYLRDTAKDRENTRLRVQRHRAKPASNENVTLHSNSNSNSNSKEEKQEGAPPALNDTWNEMAAFPQLPKVTVMTAKRKAALRTRWADAFFRENWAEAMAKIPGCPFLIGQSERGWRADFDWFLKPDSVARILEGKYDGGTGGKDSARSPRRFALADTQPDKFKGR